MSLEHDRVQIVELVSGLLIVLCCSDGIKLKHVNEQMHEWQYILKITTVIYYYRMFHYRTNFDRLRS